MKRMWIAIGILACLAAACPETPMLEPPVLLSVESERSPNTGYTVTLKWEAFPPGANGIRIERSDVYPPEWTLQKLAATSPILDYTEYDVPAGVYWYQIKAYSDVAVSLPSDVISIDLASDSEETEFDAPANFAASGSAFQTVSLSWSAVEGATGYRVFRAASGSGVFGDISGRLSSASLTYDDATVAYGTSYDYAVAVAGDAGDGERSASVAAGGWTLAAPLISSVDSATQTSLTVHWGAVDHAGSYSVYRSGSQSGSYASVATNQAGTSFADSGLAAGTSYWYKVEAVSGAYVGERSVGASGTTSSVAAPSAPGAPTVGQGASTSFVAVSWTAVSGATGYNVYRYTSNVPSLSSKLNASPVTGSYNDSSASAGYDYYYFVTAVNAGGESAKSSGTLGYLRMPTVTGLSASTVYTGYVRVTWTSISSAYRYYIYQDGVYVAYSGNSTFSYDYYPGNTSSHTYKVTAVGNYGGTSNTLRTASEGAQQATGATGRAN